MSDNFKTEWDLGKYFYKGVEDPQIDKDITEWTKYERETVAYFKENTLRDADTELILEFYRRREESGRKIAKVYLYFSYLSSLDTQDQSVLKKLSNLDNLFSKLTTESLFMSEDLKKLGYDKMMKLSKSDDLRNYKNSIVKIANGLKYNLPIDKEEIIIQKDKGGCETLSNMHSELTNSFMFEYKGEQLTSSEIRALRSGADPKVREEATMSIRKVYGSPQNKITLSSIYKGLVKDEVGEGKMRGIDYVMEGRNNSEQLSKKTVDILLKSVKDAYPTYHKYLKLKAKLQNVSYLNEWDRNAPYVGMGKEKEISFDEGVGMYLDVIKKFDTEFYDYSVDMFKNGRVDVYPKKGKRGGAFAQYVQGRESFVLLNHTGKLDDTLTLAHELGHAIHGHLSQGQKQAVYSSPLSLAETASIFNETLMFDSLIENTKTKDDKITMLVERLDGAFATIFRQSQIVLFEREIHERLRKEEELGYEDINKIWRELSSELYGDNVIFDNNPEDDEMWSQIPHIFRTPFYCYTYAFGNLLSLSLYEKYKKEGDSFIPKYKDILRAGGSIPPKELLKEHDIDISSPKFYNDGLKVIDDLVNELGGLINNK